MDTIWDLEVGEALSRLWKNLRSHWTAWLNGVIAAQNLIIGMARGSLLNIVCFVVSGSVAGLCVWMQRRRHGNREDDANHQSSAAEGTAKPTDTVPSTRTLESREGDGTDEGARQDPELTVIAPVWGFRAWALHGEQLPRLHAQNGGFIADGPGPLWLPGKNGAFCNGGRYVYHRIGGTVPEPCEVPSATCSCGFYAVRDPFQTYVGVLGGTVGWGKVIDGEEGWRSEFASVAALFCPPWIEGEQRQKLEFVAHHYGVPLCSTLEELAAKTEALANWMAGADLLQEAV
jgi:hypothetical protein